MVCTQILTYSTKPHFIPSLETIRDEPLGLSRYSIEVQLSIFAFDVEPGVFAWNVWIYRGEGIGRPIKR